MGNRKGKEPCLENERCDSEIICNLKNSHKQCKNVIRK